MLYYSKLSKPSLKSKRTQINRQKKLSILLYCIEINSPVWICKQLIN